MGYYDELDQEIDKEMGWDKGRPGSVRRSPGYWQAILRTARVSSPIWRGLRKMGAAIGRVVFFPVISPLGYTKRFNAQGDMMVVKRSILWRCLDAVLTRVLLAPVILAIFLIGVVYASTHPQRLRAASAPDNVGIYYKRVSVVTVDNQRLTGWYIPSLTADDVTFDPEGTLAAKRPGAVLCHGLGATQEQYLPLAAELHRAGFAVLMLDMRGQGESDAAAVTYGLRERLDVLAGVKFLQDTTYVDETKVCIVGHDIGATAVLQAAAIDSSIAAAVADGMWPRFEERARQIFSQPGDETSGGRIPTQWLAPLYTVTFEVAVRDRLAQLDPETVVRNIRKQPVFFIARTGPEYAPVQEVMALATTVGGHHEVMVANEKLTGDAERRITEFLVKATGWKGARAHGMEQIEGLMKNKVK